MWWSLVPWRRVNTPVVSILSWRTRVCGVIGYFSGSGAALVRAADGSVFEFVEQPNH
jgi:hypothetical protein